MQMLKAMYHTSALRLVCESSLELEALNSAVQEDQFVKNKAKADAEVEPSCQERLEILEDLWRRNKIRADAHLARLDVPTEFSASVRRLHMKKFDQLLKPFLDQAMAATPGSPGIAGRLKQHRDAVRLAEDRLMEVRGIRRPAGAQQFLLGEHLAFAECVVALRKPLLPPTPRA